MDTKQPNKRGEKILTSVGAMSLSPLKWFTRHYNKYNSREFKCDQKLLIHSWTSWKEVSLLFCASLSCFTWIYSLKVEQKIKKGKKYSKTLTKGAGGGMRDRQEVKSKLNPDMKQTAKEPPHNIWATKQVSIAYNLPFTDQWDYVISSNRYNLEEVGCVIALKIESGQ